VKKEGVFVGEKGADGGVRKVAAPEGGGGRDSKGNLGGGGLKKSGGSR